MTKARDLASSGVTLTSTTTTADAALARAGGTMTGDLAMGTNLVDGVDVSARDAVLTSTTTLASAALPKSGGAMTGAITTNSTFDGVDIATRDAVLSSTTTTATNALNNANNALPKEGGAMTGPITTNSTFDGVDVGSRDSVLTSTTTTADAALPRTGGAMTGNVTFGDNNKAIFGASSDLQIFHDGTHSYISDQGTGNLKILGAADVRIVKSDDSELSAKFVMDGAVELYHNGSKKIETTSTGVDVTGTVIVAGEGIISSATTATNLSNPILQLTGSSYTANGVYGIGFNYNTDGSGTSPVFAGYQLTSGSGNTKGNLVFGTRDTTTAGDVPLIRQAIAPNGDISFYEDTGTTAKLFWDASAESLGIGTSSPSYKADILSTNQYALRLNTTDADGCFLAIQTNGTAKGYLGSSHHLVSGTPSEDDITLRAENNLQFTTGGGSERMRIDSSGNVLVGKTVTNLGTAGITLGESGFGSFTRSGYEPLNVNRLSSDGDIAKFYKDGTTVGSIGTVSGQPYFAGATAGGIQISHLNSTNAVIVPVTAAGANSNATHDIGYSGKLFRNISISGDITVGGGVVFGPASASNVSSQTLDSYEEGTWTPTLPQGGSVGTVYSAIYTKIGNRVTVNLYFNFTATNNTSGFYIGGLPYGVSSSHYGGGNIGYLPGTDTSGWAAPLQTSSHIYFYNSNATNNLITNNVFGGSARTIILEVFYQTG